MSEHTAQVSSRDGRWLLYVVRMGVPVSQWPEHDFGPGNVPTPAERSRALTHLGFVFTDGAERAWEECSERPDDDSSPAWLLAFVQVCSRDGGLS
ncbi:DUF6303 family protein [Streptomyces microflavus]|uniref:DUF6303 family protein n=1 Tax=Streptomyces microflavus TaxID=1919 RepID=UPI00367F219D